MEGKLKDLAQQQGIRARAADNKRDVMQQILRRRGTYGEDIVMTDRERALNAQLLLTAKHIVGEPRPLTMRYS
jgi:hypothetical protein